LATVDYDVYAEGEAALGWFNAAVSLESERERTDWRGLCTACMKVMDDAFVKQGICVGHVKLLLHPKTGEGILTASSIATGRNVAVLGSVAESRDADLIVNARVETLPDQLQSIVEATLRECCGKFHVKHAIASMRCLRPGRPHPTWRYGSIIA
jgi:hypothetical protein